MKVIIAGGGTGGHVFPGLAIVEELRRRDQLLLIQWIGKKKSLEESVCAQHNIPFRAIPMLGWPRKGTLSKLITLFALGVSVLRSYQIIRRFQPQIIIGVGGYVSFPPLWCAQKLGIPTVLHEQNSKMGLANRLLAKNAEKVFLSFPLIEKLEGEGFNKDKFIISGNPVRLSFLNPPTKESAREKLGLSQTLFTVMFLGGSQGARFLNQCVKEIIDKMDPQEFQIIWLTGKNEYDHYKVYSSNNKTIIKLFPFSDNIATLMASADLIVSRAGASTLAEITTMGKPSILIPYPHATDNHQEFNAKMMEKMGASEVLLEPHTNSTELLEKIRNYIKNPETLKSRSECAKKVGKPLASEIIAEEILNLLFPPPQNSSRS
ncbi:MAG: undecaprenyldiphospho-muramoylpentapeptide beta-N-acetylglucosaminyltransferase [Candidatus Hydrogenedentes bacterium]|nr:undecaprenyldiphospho-muramoylpentapeptide beta-N-acetylglucosaminyltransferase [Candidatus Hydrogenedentota bacterium]